MVEMIGDNWVGPHSGQWQVTDPDTAAMHAAIRALDGTTRTSLTFTIEEPFRQVTIAGGPNAFVVSRELADESIIDLTNPHADPEAEPVELVCGGNRAVFDAAQVVGIDQVIAAVNTFLADFPAGVGPEWSIS